MYQQLSSPAAWRAEKVEDQAQEVIVKVAKIWVLNLQSRQVIYVKIGNLIGEE